MSLTRYDSAQIVLSLQEFGGSILGSAKEFIANAIIYDTSNTDPSNSSRTVHANIVKRSVARI